MRGEYIFDPPGTPGRGELPPRARRIRGTVHLMVLGMGTTSACAENTSGSEPQWQPHRNYLRVRGEYSIFSSHSSIWRELPPRARRIRRHAPHRGHPPGTTSACAENTVKSACSSSSIWNYLRVRGEYHRVGDTAEDIGELPPRARRIPQPAVEPAPAPGTTSACAENTICNFS